MAEAAKYFVESCFHKPLFRAPRIVYKLMVRYEDSLCDSFGGIDYFIVEKCLHTSVDEGMILGLLENLNTK